MIIYSFPYPEFRSYIRKFFENRTHFFKFFFEGVNYTENAPLICLNLKQILTKDLFKKLGSDNFILPPKKPRKNGP